MCGIIYEHSFDGSPVNNAILDQYDKQKTRGQQGFGVFDGQEMNMVREANEKNILKWLVKYDSSLLLMHHRFPTSTINVKRAAHPFSTKDYFGKTQYILVHNGGIRNAEDLYSDHFDLGIEYYSVLQDATFNDSEALLWDFALYMQGKQPGLKARGGIAFICLELHKGKLKRMHFGRNTNPLNMLRTKEGISLASEGEGEPIKTDTLYTWHYKAKRLTTKELDVPGYYVAKPHVSGAPHYGNYPAGSVMRGPYHADSYAGGEYYGRYDDGADPNCDNCEKWGYACNKHYTPGYYAEKREEEQDRQIGNLLARQFGDKFGIKDQKTEYEHDPQTQMMLPAGTRSWAERKLLEKKGTMPTEQEIDTRYIAYLAGAQGKFEVAEWTMESDYSLLEEQGDTADSVRERVLLERVIERLDDDPEYLKPESVSSLWEDRWNR